MINVEALHSGLLLCVEREDHPGLGNFVQRQMDVTTFTPDGVQDGFFSDYCLSLDNL